MRKETIIDIEERKRIRRNITYILMSTNLKNLEKSGGSPIKKDMIKIDLQEWIFGIGQFPRRQEPRLDEFKSHFFLLYD